MEKQNYSFNRGYSQIPNGKVKEFREELMSALGITTRAGFLKRMKGEVEPKISEYNTIQKTFAKYGVKEIWGN